VPMLRFIGRSSRQVDLVGEKLTDAWVLDCLHKAAGPALGRATFALVAPRPEPRRGYILYWQSADRTSRLADRMESQLRRSYHYNLARQAGQLEQIEVVRLAPDIPARSRYATELRRRGLRDGDIKPVALDGAAIWYEALAESVDGSGANGCELP
jgi:hypothetical protein